MDMEEAIMQMELIGHSFFVYRDTETDAISIVYRRNDGDYGLIETEIVPFGLTMRVLRICCSYFTPKK